MQIGFSQKDITPPLGTLLCGQLEPMPAEGVETPLMAAAFYCQSGDRAFLLASCDVVMIPAPLVDRIRQDAARATDVPADRIVVCATHTHSGPNLATIFGKDANAKVAETFCRKTIDALVEARQRARESTLYAAAGELPGWAFNRRFLMSGGTVETHPLKSDPHIICAEGPDSTRLDIVWAKDTEGCPHGACVAFGCHATVMERDNKLISADYPGKVRRCLADNLGDKATVLFVQGASGNICQVNPRDISRHEVGVGWTQEIGGAISRRALDLIRQESSPVTGALRFVSRTLAIPRRPISPELLQWTERHPPLSTGIPALSNYGVESYGALPPNMVSLEQLFKTPFWADFYANEIKTMARLREQEPRVNFSIGVIAFDNLALVALPCELFVEWADAIRAQSPFANTMVMELANGWNGYIPTRKAFERSGGYETKELSSTMLVPEAGDMVLRAVVEMLQSAYNG